MKRTGIFLILTALFLSLFPATGHSAVKAGSVCQKVGQKSKSAGKTLICAKQGTRTVWKTQVSSTAPAKSPAPIESAGAVISIMQSCMKIGEIAKAGSRSVECRQVAEGKKAYLPIDDSYPGTGVTKSPEPLKTCQIPDQRVTKINSLQAIAYPAIPSGGFVQSGKEKVVVVGIDFSDVVGSGMAKDVFEPELKTATKWINWYSNQKLNLDFVTYDNWIRAPKESAKYQSGEHGDAQGGLTQDQVAADYLSVIEKFVDISNTAAVWIVLPKQITTITGQFATRNANYSSPKYGKVFSQIYVVGSDTYRQPKTWSFFLHEHLHAQGIHGHFPNTPDMFGLMLWDGAPSRALNSWDQITLGWLESDQLYCAESKNLATVEVPIVPIEREAAGIHSIMIKTAENKVLVIESHRRDTWSPGLHPGFAGIMAYLVDTTISATYEPGSRTTGMWVNFGDKSHGKSVALEQWAPAATKYDGPVQPFDLNYVMFQGESFTVEGVKVSLVSSTNFDLVRLEKAN